MWRNASNSLLLQQCRQKRYTFITVVALAVLLIAFFITYATFSGPKPLRTLKQINVVFRHGDRTPTYSYPNDPNKNYTWQDGKGALTKKGKYELFKLGEIMRSRYDDFLGPIYRPEEVMMTSSYAPRAQMSAMTFLAGLFPPKSFQIWNTDLLWQPIPVNPIPRKIDNLIAAKAECVKFAMEKKKSDAEIEKNLSTEEKKFLEILTEKTGDQISDISKAESLYYTLKIQEDSKLELPSWADAEVLSKLADFAGSNLASYTRTDVLKRLQAGPLLKEIIGNMRHPKSSRKANFYSGHDLTLVSLLRSLGLDNKSLYLPEYGAALVIEYHEPDDDKENGFIQVFYHRNAEDTNPVHYHLPDCEIDCLLTEFIHNISKYIPENWEAECNS